MSFFLTVLTPRYNDIIAHCILWGPPQKRNKAIMPLAKYTRPMLPVESRHRHERERASRSWPAKTSCEQVDLRKRRVGACSSRRFPSPDSSLRAHLIRTLRGRHRSDHIASTLTVAPTHHVEQTVKMRDDRTSRRNSLPIRFAHDVYISGEGARPHAEVALRRKQQKSPC